MSESHPAPACRRSSSPLQKSQDTGTTGETIGPTELHQRFASVVGQAFSLSGLLPRADLQQNPRNTISSASAYTRSTVFGRPFR